MKKLQLVNEHLVSAIFSLKLSRGDTKMSMQNLCRWLIVPLRKGSRPMVTGDQVMGRLGFIARYLRPCKRNLKCVLRTEA